MNPSGVIFHVMRFSVHDGPGIRTAVFFKGCPLSCWWCHNPESQQPEPEVLFNPERCLHCGVGQTVCGAEARTVAGRTMTAREILAEIERDVVFFDESGGGVTFTGGEPLAQPELLEALLHGCRERRIHTTIETCGAAPRDVLLRIAGLAGLVLYDLKLVNDARHRQYTGAGNRNILENLRALAAAHPAVTVRVPVVPGINDSPEDRREMREFLATLPDVPVQLLPYHRTGADKYRRLGREYRLEHTATPGDAALAAFAADIGRSYA